tara:strand:+ start:3311 stop:5239 length:1929 start_codon:yes stop_codon:yes gene_type:complete
MAPFNEEQLKAQRDLYRDINEQIRNMEAGSKEFDNSLVKQNANLKAMMEGLQDSAGTIDGIGFSNFNDLADTVSDISKGQLNISDALTGQAKMNAKGSRHAAKAYGMEVKRLRVETIKNQAMSTADGLTGGMVSKTKETLGFAKQMGPKFLAAGAAVGVVGFIIGGLVKSLKFASEMIDTLGGSFGVIGTQASNFRDSMMNASIDVISLGRGTADVVSVVSTLSSEFGVGLTAAADISEKIIDTAAATGMATSEAAKLFGTFMSIADLTAKQSEELIESTYQLAAQNRVSPVAVMQDIAGSAKLIADFGADNLDSITKAAVQARKLGLNLDDVSTIADSLLNFQESLNAETEASIMIGRRLNLQKARELALEGDLNGVMGEVLKQVGDEAELNRLNVLERRALASAVGLTTTQLTKLIRAQDKSVVQQKTFVDLLGEDGMSALTSVINKFKELGATAMKEFGVPLADAVQNFQKNFFTEENIERIKNFIKNLVTTIGRVAKAMFSIFKGIYNVVDTLTFGSLPNFSTLFPPVEDGIMVDDFMSSGGSHLIVTPTGNLIQTNPNDTVFGSTKVNDFTSGPAGSMPIGNDKPVKIDNSELIRQNEEMKNEMIQLRRDMASYFGFGGSATKSIGSAVGSKISEMG